MKRYHELDALRGVAALAVLFAHLWFTLPNFWHMAHLSFANAYTHQLDFLLKYSPGRILVAGPAAVTVFFVLSGFVLASSLDKRQPVRFIAFITKRICRIILPFWATIVLAIFLFVTVGAKIAEGVSGWLNSDTWSEPLSGGLVLGHALMFGTRKLQTLDPPIWSLVIEIRVSLVFPLLFSLIAMYPLAGNAVVAAVYVAASLYMTHLGQTIPDNLLESLAFTLEFLPLFALGITLYLYREKLSARYRESTWFVRRGLLLAVWFTFCLPNLGPVTTLSPVVKFGWMVALGVASSSAIILALNSSLLSKLLWGAPLQWLGRISYSLYLTHILVILTLVRVLSGFLPVEVTLLLTIPCCLAVASVVWYLVERPSIQLGRVLLTSIQPRVPRPVELS